MILARLNHTIVSSVLTVRTSINVPVQRSSQNCFFHSSRVLGSWLNGVPVITHESDLTPGLANRITMYFAQRVCTTFEETLQHLPKHKGEFIGAIVRPELKQGDREQGLMLCGFDRTKPVILVVGGSLGSAQINQVIRSLLDLLLAKFQVIHICGKGNIDSSIKKLGYKQFEYVTENLPHLMSLCDLVISRAGSNFMFEFLALRKPMILIPLSKKSSRGDQVENAMAFQAQGFAEVIESENLNEQQLLKSIQLVFDNRQQYLSQIQNWNSDRALSRLWEIITAESVHR